MKLLVDGREYATYHGASWLKIFQHEVSNDNNTFFSSKDEMMSCNSNGKYSIINEVSSRKPPVGTKLEFLLIYTELCIYIRWKQANFPLNQPKTSDYVLDCENISIHFTDSDC